MTVEEFDRIPNHCCDPRFRYELIRGVLVVSPFAGPGEVSPNDELGYLLKRYRDDHPQGFLLDESLFEQYLHTANRRRCDRAIWIGLGRTPDVERDVPTIVVEFVGPRKRDFLRDYEEKRDEYLAAGVREYWVIDRFRRTMTVYRPDVGGQATAQTVAEPQEYQTPLLPGFVLPLALLLARADALTPKKRKR
jgi:Uma2 family endonuclease